MPASRSTGRAHSALFLLSIIALAACQSTPSSFKASSPRRTLEEVQLRSMPTDLESTFVVRDLGTGVTRVENRERAEQPFIPASTFKIPNSIIALELGILTSAESSLSYDAQRDPRQEWWPVSWTKDHTLRSAFAESVVWYYQELARRIGEESMRTWLARLDYGNHAIEGGIDRFWLNGALRVTALQQVDFLERLVRDELPISPHTVRIMRDILLIEETPTYRLFGKTGTATPADQPEIGWLVGYVEANGRTSVFAFNIGGTNVWESYPRQRRVAIVRRALHELGVIPASRE